MSMITLSRSNHNRYAVFYMIAGIVLSLSILAALLMPHPAYAQSEQVQVYESVVIQEGDTLWDLARRYNTTEEGIREVNDIKEGTLRPGDRLLIFKENMGIL